MARKGWGELSPKYRARLERGGVTQTQYEAGKPLSKARGHAQTPEHPSDRFKDSRRYRRYENRHKGILTIQKVGNTASPTRVYGASTRERSIIGRYMNAARTYIDSGDESKLSEFRSRYGDVRIGPDRIRLETDPDSIETVIRENPDFDFEHLYKEDEAA